MKTIKLLFFDDERNFYDPVWKDFSYCWGKAYPRIIIEHRTDKDYFDDYRVARDFIDSSINQYQVFFADLLVPADARGGNDDKLALGLELIESARKNPNCIIVAITATAVKKYPLLKETAYQKGADIVVIRSEFNELSRSRELCREIYEKCLEKNIVEDEIPLEKEDNPKLNYIISQIGENNIRSLYKKTLHNAANLTKIGVDYIAPGLSGAYVLKMRAFEEGQAIATHLLKINRDIEMLKKEINNRPLLGRYKKLFINYLQNKESLEKLPESGKWFAISAVFENNSLTLRDWLRSPQKPNTVSEILKTLFYSDREGLAVGYSELLTRRKIISEALNLTSSRLARVLMSLEELDEIWSHPELGSDNKSAEKYNRIENFLLKKDEFWSEAEFSFAPCHADFHTRNILIDVAGAPKPTIIDTAEFGSYHWSTDYVRLIVDLILTSFDFGVDSYLWKNLPKWILTGESIINSQKIDERSRDNQSVRTAINWLIENYKQIFVFIRSQEDSKQFQWELQLSLAVEFLRGAYRSDISTPKRVLALHLGYFSLTKASDSFKSRK